MIKLLIKYGNDNKIILNLNEKNKWECYPFLVATNKNNIEIIQLLIEYANKNNIVLELNKESKNGDNPIFWAIDRNNPEMFELLAEYSVKKTNQNNHQWKRYWKNNFKKFKFCTFKKYFRN